MEHMAEQPFIVVSQSGKSPDLLASAEVAREAGAIVIAIVNDENSPLVRLADIVMPLRAGPERSVAATKSFIATLAAFAQIMSECIDRQAFEPVISALPEIGRSTRLNSSHSCAPRMPSSAGTKKNNIP